MPRFIIERGIPNVGNSTQDVLRSISQKSNAVLKEMGPQIEWIESYVTGDKIYCVYNAENKELVLEHARKGGFPADKIEEVKNIVSPATADS